MDFSYSVLPSDTFASATFEPTYTFDWPTSYHQRLRLLTWAYA